jgi:CheY-like chemotaxis protein
METLVADDTSTIESLPSGSRDRKTLSTDLPARRPVLICEDDEGIRELLLDAVHGEGFEVSAVSNGRDALELLRRGPGRYLLLLDLMMPDISGYDILERMNDDPLLLGNNIVVVVSATGFIRPVSPGILQKRIIQGMLKKPFELEDLFALLHRLA